MLSIGDFARHGRVSVRMLRHYDAIGLLKPAYVDRITGYRSYEAGQLSRLNRIVALKGLGFTLQQVHSILDEEVSVEELRGMLRLREAELHSQIATDTARLAQVEARLRIIEREGTMPADDVQIKRIPGVRVAELTGTAASFEPESIAPVIGPIYNELRDRLDRAGLTPPAQPLPTTRILRMATGFSFTPPFRSTPIPARNTTSRSWTCPRSSKRPRSCIAAPWTTSCRPSRRWPAESTPTATARPVTTASFTSSAARTEIRG
jgi:DNA-binding transcriptional MerR regulator